MSNCIFQGMRLSLQILGNGISNVDVGYFDVGDRWVFFLLEMVRQLLEFDKDDRIRFSTC